MQINLDPNQAGLGRVPLATLLPLAQRCGFDAVTFPLWEIATAQQAQAATAQVRDHGLQWSMMPMDIDMMRECSGAEFAADLEQLQRQMDLAQTAGVPRYYNHIWPGSNERARDDNFAWCVDRFGKVFETARAHSLQAGVEFLGPKPLRDSFRYPFIWTLKEILTLADAISPQVGVQFRYLPLVYVRHHPRRDQAAGQRRSRGRRPPQRRLEGPLPRPAGGPGA